jgi:Flp pilus assembly protein TadG
VRRRAPRRRGERGQALVEFALILPVLLLLVLGIIEFGRAWNLSQIITDAAREGARQAVLHDLAITEDSVHRLIQNRLWAARVDTTVVAITYSATTANGNWKNTGVEQTVTVSFPYSWMFFGPALRPITFVSSFTMRNE